MKKFLLSLILAVFLVCPALSGAYTLDPDGGTQPGNDYEFNNFQFIGQSLVENTFGTFAGDQVGTFTELGTFNFLTYNSINLITGTAYEISVIFEGSGDIFDPAGEDPYFEFTDGILHWYAEEVADSSAVAYATDDQSDGSFMGTDGGAAVEFATFDLTSGGGTLSTDYSDVDGFVTAYFIATDIQDEYLFYGGIDMTNWVVGESIVTLGFAHTTASNNYEDGDITDPFGYEVAEYRGGSAPTHDEDAFDGFQTIYTDNQGNFEISVVPEPTTMVLFGLGLLGLSGIGRRKK